MKEKQPDTNQENLDQSNEGRGFVSNELADFSCLMVNIMDYYETKGKPDEGEEWKSHQDLVDEDVDENVKKAFISLLKKYQ
jgi:hypothetical protein